MDFDGVLTDNRVWVDEQGVESVRCDRADGLGLDFARAFLSENEISCELVIVSTESNPVVHRRAMKLSLACHQDVGDKLAFLESFVRERFPSISDPFSGMIYLGNDLNDLSVMRRAGFSLAPSDAHPRVQEVADVVSNRPGGNGFVRAFVAGTRFEK